MVTLARACIAFAVVAAAAAPARAEPLRVVETAIAGDRGIVRALDRDAQTSWCPGAATAELRFAVPLHAPTIHIVRAPRATGLYTPLRIETDAGAVIMANASGDADEHERMVQDDTQVAGDTRVIRVSGLTAIRRADDCIAEIVVDADEGTVVFEVDAVAVSALGHAMEAGTLCERIPPARTVKWFDSAEAGREWFVQNTPIGSATRANEVGWCKRLTERICGEHGDERCAGLVGGIGPGLVRLGAHNHDFFDFAWIDHRWSLRAIHDAQFE